jgi:hypothetical protein
VPTAGLKDKGGDAKAQWEAYIVATVGGRIIDMGWRRATNNGKGTPPTEEKVLGYACSTATLRDAVMEEMGFEAVGEFNECFPVNSGGACKLIRIEEKEEAHTTFEVVDMRRL